MDAEKEVINNEYLNDEEVVQTDGNDDPAVIETNTGEYGESFEDTEEKLEDSSVTDPIEGEELEDREFDTQAPYEENEHNDEFSGFDEYGQEAKTMEEIVEDNTGKEVEDIDDNVGYYMDAEKKDDMFEVEHIEMPINGGDDVEPMGEGDLEDQPEQNDSPIDGNDLGTSTGTDTVTEYENVMDDVRNEPEFNDDGKTGTEEITDVEEAFDAPVDGDEYQDEKVAASMEDQEPEEEDIPTEDEIEDGVETEEIESYPSDDESWESTIEEDPLEEPMGDDDFDPTEAGRDDFYEDGGANDEVMEEYEELDDEYSDDDDSDEVPTEDEEVEEFEENDDEDDDEEEDEKEDEDDGE
jgi:hypothetical protein